MEIFNTMLAKVNGLGTKKVMGVTIGAAALVAVVVLIAKRYK